MSERMAVVRGMARVAWGVLELSSTGVGRDQNKEIKS